MKKLLIPIDGSPVSIKAAEKAIALGRLLESELTFVSVVNMPSEDKYASYGMNIEQQFSANRKEMIKKLIQEETKMLKIIVRNLDIDNIKVVQKVIVGRPAAEIIKLAEEEHFDYIFIGRGGSSAIDRLFVGSVAQKVIAASPCPVVVVNG